MTDKSLPASKSIADGMKTNLRSSPKVASSAWSADGASASKDVKCERCWHYVADVGADAGHPTLCGRCISNLYGAGETRKVA